MASVQEYVKKLPTETLLSQLPNYENKEDSWSQLVTQAILTALLERGIILSEK